MSHRATGSLVASFGNLVCKLSSVTNSKWCKSLNRFGCYLQWFLVNVAPWETYSFSSFCLHCFWGGQERKRQLGNVPGLKEEKSRNIDWNGNVGLNPSPVRTLGYEARLPCRPAWPTQRQTSFHITRSVWFAHISQNYYVSYRGWFALPKSPHIRGGNKNKRKVTFCNIN